MLNTVPNFVGSRKLYCTLYVLRSIFAFAYDISCRGRPILLLLLLHVIYILLCDEVERGHGDILLKNADLIQVTVHVFRFCCSGMPSRSYS